MTKLHQFHRIVENIRFTTEDLEALRILEAPIDAERNAEGRVDPTWRLGTRPPSISWQKKNNNNRNHRQPKLTSFVYMEEPIGS